MTAPASQRHRVPTEGASGREPSIPVLRPLLPTVDRLLPYLARIDESRTYSNWGPLVYELQERLCRGLEQPPGSIVCASSGTTALVGAILATAGRAASDRPLAVVPALTFVATPLAVEECGFAPVVADVDATTWSLDPSRLEQELDLDRVGLIVPVAPFGRPIAQRGWQTFRRRTGIPVVIDGAASFDLTAPSSQLLLGDIPVTMSFHATKAFSSGEGGCVACGRSDAATDVMRALNFGFYEGRKAVSASTNGKMSEYHAAVGLAELDGWPAKQARLEGVVALYVDAFTHAGLSDRLVGAPAVGLSYVLFRAGNVAESVAVQRSLRAHGIDFRLWYGPCVHRHPHFAGVAREGLDTADDLAARLIGLPVAPDLPPAEVARVADAARAGAAAAGEAG
jgi:dTDP-4-amino-4,6-dideoxygalactose transaminase